MTRRCYFKTRKQKTNSYSLRKKSNNNNNKHNCYNIKDGHGVKSESRKGMVGKGQSKVIFTTQSLSLVSVRESYSNDHECSSYKSLSHKKESFVTTLKLRSR